MLKPIGILTMCLFVVISKAQVSPIDNAVLNYRLAGFSVQENTKAASYLFQLAKGDIANEQVFLKSVIIQHKTNKPSDIAELPNWGKKYTWRVVYKDKDGKEIGNSGLHHIETGITPFVDTSKNGLVVLRRATDHKDLYVLTDRNLVMYDMAGNPVWYMPDIPEIKKRDISIRDFKATADGTFTFLTQEDALEIDYNGKVVWKAPNDGKVSGKNKEGYHHELTKLSNGHYMVAGSEIVKKPIPGLPEEYFAETDKSVTKGSNGIYYKEFTCGTLIEYDTAGNVVWSWRTAEHMTDADFFWNKADLVQPYDGNPYMNSFDVIEVDKVIFISYKNNNTVLKISYPAGNVLARYGDEGSARHHYSLFYGQHSVRYNSRTNELCLFNNNHSDIIPVSATQVDEAGYVVSHVSKYKVPPGNSNSLIKNWDMGIRLTDDKNAAQTAIRGGSVSILDDDCLLVNMGTLNLMLILDKQKRKIWEAAPYTTEDGRRAPLLPYRCSFIHKGDLEKILLAVK